MCLTSLPATPYPAGLIDSNTTFYIYDTGANVGKIVSRAPKILLQSPEQLQADAAVVSVLT